MYVGFRSTLNFQNFKVALNPKHRFFLGTLPKVATYGVYQSSMIYKKIHRAVFELYAHKAIMKGVFRSEAVALVTYCVHL